MVAGAQTLSGAATGEDSEKVGPVNSQGFGICADSLEIGTAFDRLPLSGLGIDLLCVHLLWRATACQKESRNAYHDNGKITQRRIICGTIA